MRSENVRHDITIVGGGLAGTCAAIAAARLGASVALVTNRPVLGGNSSSEVRVWVVGATGHGKNHFAREGGIMGELFVENQYRNIDGNPYIWDALLLDLVRADAGISLYLNTDVREVEAADVGDSGDLHERRISALTGWTMGSERLIRFESDVFLDCTGDGLVGFLAGAKHRIGREARSEYGEDWAPEVADDVTLGSTLLFYTKDAGHPVAFVPPSFAKDISKTSIPERRIIKAGDNGCAYWWIEFGGELDTVHDNEAIRDELWSVVYGIWDHIKNSGKFDAETMTLEWVGSIPGKREYRRFLGDHVLTQGDILGQTEFDDRVAFGGWSIDLHPARGMYAAEDGAKQRFADGVYHIPYRSLYSANVSNLLFAGRDISASHVAFGSTRVMATCATLGQAAGTAAALCAAEGVSPSGLDVAALQRTLLRQDASVVGIALDDPDDHAARGTVTASSTLTRLASGTPDSPAPTTSWPLAADAGIVLPVDPALDEFSLLVDATQDTELIVELYDPELGQNYVPRKLVDTVRLAVPAGTQQWVKTGLSWSPESPRNAFLVVNANPDVSLRVSEQGVPGVLCLSRIPLRPKDEAPQLLREWTDTDLRHRVFSFDAGSTAAFAPAKSVDGYARPFGGPHMWVGEPDGPQWLQVAWPEPVPVARIEVVLDDDVDEDLINLHHHRTPEPVMPTLVRDYRVELRTADGQWETVARVAGNRRRRNVHVLGGPGPETTGRTTSAVRIVVESTNGAPSAHVVAVRVY
ncbi:FAD-dependent oxidoreductase [Catenulispora pinisilvae]|uniref:FAD-dependent oxidoreductase n=1 Tax=Catenulispora pinisilvae TaxID=2705253 RepID=UPI0018910907|nr:FAD-dependent oxidoreductase [Catenulispora pinisilvae]